MEIEVISKQENPLLDRIEVEFRAVHPKEPTPTREHVREGIAKTLEVTKDRVVIDHMNSVFGTGECVGYAKIYRSKSDAQRMESEHVLKRNHLYEKKEKTSAKEKTE